MSSARVLGSEATGRAWGYRKEDTSSHRVGTFSKNLEYQNRISEHLKIQGKIRTQIHDIKPNDNINDHHYY